LQVCQPRFGQLVRKGLAPSAWIFSNSRTLTSHDKSHIFFSDGQAANSFTHEEWRERLSSKLARGGLIDYCGIHVIGVDDDGVILEMPITHNHLQAMGQAHGGSLATLCDTVAGFATITKLPAGHRFVTINLNVNFLGSAKEGEVVVARSHAVHLGKSTHVWDCRGWEKKSGRLLVVCRATKMVMKNN